MLSAKNDDDLRRWRDSISTVAGLRPEKKDAVSDAGGALGGREPTLAASSRSTAADTRGGHTGDVGIA